MIRSVRPDNLIPPDYMELKEPIITGRLFCFACFEGGEGG